MARVRDMPAQPDDFRSQGQTGRERHAAIVTRLIRRRHTASFNFGTSTLLANRSSRLLSLLQVGFNLAQVILRRK